VTDQTDTPEVPLTTRLLMSASALKLLANSDAYAAGGGEGVATLEAIEAAIKRGAGADRITDRGPACTGITASWCPRCGDCKCPPLRKEVGDMDAPGCPLHALDSAHAEDPEVGALQEEAAREAAAAARWKARTT